jgi:hypothetical protein
MEDFILDTENCTNWCVFLAAGVFLVGTFLFESPMAHKNGFLRNAIGKK